MKRTFPRWLITLPVILLTGRLLAQPIQILPEPVSVTARSGVFRFTQHTRLCLLTEDKEAIRVTRDFLRQLRTATGLALPVSFAPRASPIAPASSPPPASFTPAASSISPQPEGTPAGNPPERGGDIVISIGPTPGITNREGYLLDIESKEIRISAPGPAGLFYALETIRQLLPVLPFPTPSSRSPQSSPPAQSPHLAQSPQQPQSSRPAQSSQLAQSPYPPILPCARILDYPRYPYRGMHLDVSRHFFSVAFIKQYLDILAAYKINTFHWHLTDSHGWRLEIKKYPRLTSVGAWRADRKGIPMTIAPVTGRDEPATYGGYYTQDQVREVLQYAKDRFITVIPEIEMPGHCTAALVAYPQYSDRNNKNPLLIPCGYPGDLVHNFCAGYDSTFIFLENILREVMQLFPSPFIHIGGDEVRAEPWLNCPRCRARMKEHGFTTARQLQAWFTGRIDSFITANGRRTIGWDEIREADLQPSSAIMSWHGDTGGLAGAARGHDVVMTPYHYTYFDFYQSDPRLEPDITYAPLFLDTVYAFNPSPTGLDQRSDGHILGGEACLWTENVPTPARVEYMLLPRLLALSEVLWSPLEKKDYPRFIDKVEQQFRRFDAAGIHYATSLYNPSIQPAFDSANKSISVTLSDQAHKYQLRYTTDGSLPTPQSALYERPLVITRDARLKSAVFRQGRRLGKINEDVYALHKAVGASLKVEPAGDAEANQSYKRLLDGIAGTIEPYDGRWVSFHDSVITLTIDLDSLQVVHSISVNCMEDQVGELYLPREVAVAGSADGQHFSSFYSVLNKTVPQQLLRHVVTYRKERLNKTVRFIRVRIKNANLSPQADKNGIMLDELIIR